MINWMDRRPHYPCEPLELPPRPGQNFFDREQVCGALSFYAEFNKERKKLPTMKDKMLSALKEDDRKIRRFLQLKKHDIHKKQNAKFRYKRI
jgi:hypothetical protein